MTQAVGTLPSGRVPDLWTRLKTWVAHNRGSSFVRRAGVAIWLNLLVAGVAAATVVLTSAPPEGLPARETWAVGALKLFALWCLSFLPGWLYVRFLGLRAGVLWVEYVLNLHRLGWDRRESLPALPPGCQHHDAADHTESQANIYRLKFDAYYGRKVSRSAVDATDDEDFAVSVETLFPVFLCTTVLAVGWAAVLYDTAALAQPSGPWDALKFGFLGAYAFAVSMLVRRFFQSDLRPSAYAGVVLRIVLVLLIVATVHQLFMMGSQSGGKLTATEMITAFVIGFFPLVGLQALQRVASKALRVAVPQLSPDYPLDQLDGLNVWYEARLTEEGVEDMQNLTTMNLVDVILHTRVPVGRLVDWVDQAFLYIHLEPVERKQLAERRRQGCLDGRPSRSGLATRIALRRVGIRTATDLLRAVPEPGSPPQHLVDCGLDAAQIRVLVSVLCDEQGLEPVRNWQRGGVPGVEEPAA